MFIPLDEVKTGMKLEYAAKDKAGRVLLNAGTLLDDGKVKALRGWGINRVYVTTESVYEAIKDPAERQVFLDKHNSQVSEQELKHYFRHTNTRHPFMEELFNECLARLSKARGAQ